MSEADHKRLFLSPPHLSGHESRFVAEAFESNYIAPVGAQIERFERAFCDYTGYAAAVALSSASAALHLALVLERVGRGSLVLAPSLTFVATIGASHHMGAEIRFVDSSESTWTLDPGCLAEGVESCVKNSKIPSAVIATDLYGQCVDVDQIREVCDRYDIPLISDSAAAVGSCYKGRHAGRSASSAAFSFNGNKIATTGGGGILASDNREKVERALNLATQARVPGVAHYEHEEVGFNYRLSNVLAAIGRGQLELMKSRVNAKRKIAKAYRAALEGLSGLSFMPEASYGRSNHWLTVIRVDERGAPTSCARIQARLEKFNIESARVVKPLTCPP